MRIGDSGGWSRARARARFAMRLGGLALASEQVAQIGCHLLRVVWYCGGEVRLGSNDGLQGEIAMSDTLVLYWPQKGSAATKRCSDSCDVVSSCRKMDISRHS